MTKLVRFDWAIKNLLRNKANFDILEGLLSELLKTSIRIEQILESKSNKNHAEDKFNRVDLLAITTERQHVIIEVQCLGQWDYLSRILYGVSKAVCEHIGEGEAYHNIRKVISVSIVFFDLGHGKDYLYRGTTSFHGLHYHDTLMLNAQEKELYSQGPDMGLETPEEVFPEYYIVKVSAFHEKVKDKFDEWIYFLKHGKIEKGFAAQGLQSAMEKLDILKLSEKERRAYEKYQEGLRDDASLKDMLDITEQRGREEMQLQIARTMKQTGIADSEIAVYTQLPLEEIKKL